jgi:hypothetical protein
MRRFLIGDAFARCSPLTLLLVACFMLSGCAGSSSIGAAHNHALKKKHLEFMGRCDVGAEAHSVAISGDTAYVALGLKGLAVADIANPRAPRLVQWMKEGVKAVFVAVDGKRAYVADRYEGIQILDLTRTRQPEIVCKFVLPPFVTYLAVTPKLIYAACGGEGIHILRKEKDGALTRIGLFRDVKFSRYILLDGNIAYVADGYEDAFKILDVSSPEHIELLSATNIGGYCDAVAKRGEFVFLASRSDGFVVMDVASPKQPKLVRRVKKPGVWVKNLALSGSMLVVANDRAGIELYDVTDCSDPQLLDVFDLPAQAGSKGRAAWVTIVGDLVYVADWDGGLLILKITAAK